MFHFLTKQNYNKYSQISMSMSFSSSEASTMFRSSTASSTSESVIFSKGLSLFLSSRTDNCDFSCWRPAWQGSFGLKQWILSSSKILDRELNYMKTKYSHFEIEHELSEERILMPYVTSSKWTESAAVTDLPELLKDINFVFILRLV